MVRKKQLIKGIAGLVFAALMMQTVACGTLMYPERRGQTSGRIDPGVAILDGVGLLFFIIPGAIAFAVDFTTGSIYLPGSKKSAAISSESREMQVVQVAPAELNQARIEAVVGQETGHSIRLDRDNVSAYELDRQTGADTEDLAALLTQLNQTPRQN